jgi:hypothetical protein
MYVGNHWIDILCHVCWIVCNLFWFRLVLSFVTIQLFELSRRAKLTEVWFCCAQEGFVRPRHALQEWADTLRHGRDRSAMSYQTYE